MRVIAGTARGVQLKTPEGMQTRPTIDRVKEALFSIIHFDIPGAKVLKKTGQFPPNQPGCRCAEVPNQQ